MCVTVCERPALGDIHTQTQESLHLPLLRLPSVPVSRCVCVCVSAVAIRYREVTCPTWDLMLHSTKPQSTHTHARTHICTQTHAHAHTHNGCDFETTGYFKFFSTINNYNQNWHFHNKRNISMLYMQILC